MGSRNQQRGRAGRRSGTLGRLLCAISPWGLHWLLSILVNFSQVLVRIGTCTLQLFRIKLLILIPALGFLL